MNGTPETSDQKIEELLRKSGQATKGLSRDRNVYVLGQLNNRADAYRDEDEAVARALQLDKLRKIPLIGRFLVLIALATKDGK